MAGENSDRNKGSSSLLQQMIAAWNIPKKRDPFRHVCIRKKIPSISIVPLHSRDFTQEGGGSALRRMLLMSLDHTAQNCTRRHRRAVQIACAINHKPESGSEGKTKKAHTTHGRENPPIPFTTRVQSLEWSHNMAWIAIDRSLPFDDVSAEMKGPLSSLLFATQNEFPGKQNKS